jgi:cytochrome c553
MRVFSVCATTFLLMITVVAAQAPAPKRAPAARAVPAPPARPDGDLAQLMRGILFPNSNLLFDVQEHDPGAPPKQDDSTGASHNYANVYDGWQVVEGAAVALEESADLILRPGRSCSNGKPAPVGRADYIKFAGQLREAGRKTLAAAKARGQSQVSDLTSDVADACANCHEVYRDKGPAGSPARCAP